MGDQQEVVWRTVFPCESRVCGYLSDDYLEKPAFCPRCGEHVTIGSAEYSVSYAPLVWWNPLSWLGEQIFTRTATPVKHYADQIGVRR